MNSEPSIFTTSIIRNILISVTVCTMMVSSCTLIDSFDESEVYSSKTEYTRQTALLKNLDNEKVILLEKIKSEEYIEITKNKDIAVRDLIDNHGYHPLLARCTVYGWQNDNERAMCSSLNTNSQPGIEKR